jgi:O-antigen/teichoic acid export membrane protein
LNTETVNPRPERRVAINSSLLLMAYGFQALVSLVLVGILARYLGQAGLGRYAYIISFTELFTVLVDMGMNRILVREIAKDQNSATRLTSAIWTLRLVLSLVIFLVVAALSAGDGDPYLWLATMTFFMAQVIYLLGDVFAAAFQGYQRMEHQFWSILIAQVLMLALTLGVVWLDLGLIALFGARVVANSARLAYVWWISVHKGFAEAHFMPGVVAGAAAALRSFPAAVPLWRRSGRNAASALIQAQGQRLVRRWDDARLAWYLFVESLPVGISLLLSNYVWRFGVVLTVLWLGQEQGDLVNGVLYGPLRAVQQVRIIPAAFAAAMLPVFSDRAANRMDEFDTAFAKTIKLFTAISLLITLAFTFLADPLVTLLLGDTIDLSMAAVVLAWLSWVIVLNFPNWLYSVTLVALGRQKLETLGLALGLVVGFLVAWWGIPRLQAMGVVYSILAAEGVYFVVGTVAMRRHFHWRQLAPSLGKVVLACMLAGAVFLAGGRLWTGLAEAGRVPVNTWGALLEVAVVGAAGLAVFFVALLLLRTFNEDEKEAIAAMIRLR